MVAKIGRPTTEPKTNDTRLRMTDKQLEMLNYCVEMTGKTKTDIMMLGLEYVYNQIKK